MDTSPASIARQVADRIAAAGIKVEAAQGWGISDTGHRVEGWEAAAAAVRIQLPRRFESIAEVVIARLKEAGAADARVLPAGYGQGIQLQCVVSDDTAAAITAFDATRLVDHPCEICGSPISAGRVKAQTATCSAECAEMKRSKAEARAVALASVTEAADRIKAARVADEPLSLADRRREVKQMLDSCPTAATADIAEALGISKTTAYNDMRHTGMRR